MLGASFVFSHFISFFPRSGPEFGIWRVTREMTQDRCTDNTNHHYWKKGPRISLNASNSAAAMRAIGQVQGLYVPTQKTPVNSWDFFQTLLGSATMHIITKSCANIIFKVRQVRHLQRTSPLHAGISDLNLNYATVNR